MALSKWLTKRTVKVVDELFDWRATIELTGEMLIKEGAIDPSYIQSIYEQQKKFGHYYILCPQVAMPHTVPEAGVHHVGLSLLIIKNGVYFDIGENDPITIVLMLAMTSRQSNIVIIREIAELFSEHRSIHQLQKATDVEALLQIIHDFDSHKGVP